MDVAIHFSPNRAEWLQERYWHHSQRFEVQTDGSVILYMKCEGLISLTRWVLGFYGDAVPLTPPELINAVTREVKKLQAKFVEKNDSQKK